MIIAFSLAGSAAGQPAGDASPIRISGEFRTDAAFTSREPPYYADVLEAVVDLDLQRSLGWTGARAHLDAIHTFCLCAVDVASRPPRTLDQDVVPTRHIRLYEAWLDQSFASGAVSLRLGAYDLKSEFARIGAADGLINAGFGVSPELAGSGPYGAPSFPSTSLAARLQLRPSQHLYLMAVALNATPGAIGDPGGLDLSFRRGALLLGEAGVTQGGRFALGYWRYTADGPAGRLPARLQSRSGGYVLYEAPLSSPPAAEPSLAAFIRAGLADSGDSFRGSVQAGLRLDRPFAARPASALTLGVTRSQTEQPLQGRGPLPARWSWRAQTAVELGYADRITPVLRLQPDLQWARWSGPARARQDTVAFTLRATLRLPGG
jgi:porin